MRYEFHPEALDEYEAAALYYSSCQNGLELRFMACVEATFDRITEAPTRWHLLEQDIRQCLVQVFPYTVLYTIEPDHIVIIAVMHCHRKPGYWRHRV